MFSVKKTTQVVAYLTWKGGNEIEYLRLMKLLYLSERDFLLAYNSRLTGDDLCCMNKGPVLSHSYDLIKEMPVGYWTDLLDKNGFNLIFKKAACVNPDDPLEFFDELSPAEMEIIDSIYEKFGHLDTWKTVDATHDKNICPEWVDPGKTSIPLTIEDILIAHGKTEEDIKSIMEELAYNDSLQENARSLA